MQFNVLPNSSHPETATQPDVFVVGGGPAGLACAIAAAQQGLTVEVADGMKPPIDKACGEGLMPDTLEALAQLGIDGTTLATIQSHPFYGIRFLSTEPSRSSELRQPISTQALFPVGAGRGIRRVVLHQLLLDRASALGVRLNWQTVVQSTEAASAGGPNPGRGVVRTNRHTSYPRFLIGADGHQSRIRTWAGLNRASISARRIGLRQHFAITPWSDCVEVYWSDHGQAYVTPVAANEICVAFIAHRKFSSVAEALTHFPELRQHLVQALPSNVPRGSITLSRKLHRVTRGNIALVGDASGSVDAVTGEGLGLCFRQALALAVALRDNHLASYQQAHVALQRLPHLMGRTMLLLDSSPRIRTHALTALQRRPRFFEQMLGVHVGQTPLRLFGRTGLLASFLCLLAG